LCKSIPNSHKEFILIFLLIDKFQNVRRLNYQWQIICG